MFYAQLTSKMERTGKESLGKKRKEKATVLMWVTNTEGVTKKEKGDSSVWVKNTEGVAKKRQRKATVLMWVKNVERSKAAQEKGEGQLTSSPTFSFWWKSNSWQFFISESSRRFNSFMASCPHTHSINRCNKL